MLILVTVVLLAVVVYLFKVFVVVMLGLAAICIRQHEKTL